MALFGPEEAKCNNGERCLIQLGPTGPEGDNEKERRNVRRPPRGTKLGKTAKTTLNIQPGFW